VESLARPGGNVTGLSNVAPELSGLKLELPREIAPKVSRLAILWNQASLVEPLGLQALLGAAPAAGWTSSRSRCPPPTTTPSPPWLRGAPMP
jgi:putative ABC transport system substrate-binding protein